MKSVLGSTTAGADGTKTQRVGIFPDMEVMPRIQGLREGRDEIPEKAVELIENSDI